MTTTAAVDRVTPLLKGALPPTLIVGVATTIGAALLAGQRGALGAGLGMVIVVLFSGTGLLAMRLVRTADPMLVMVVGMGSYAIRIVLFGASIMVLGAIDGIDDVLHRTATAIAVLLCVAAWLTGEIRAYTKLRIPTYDVELPAPPTEEGA